MAYKGPRFHWKCLGASQVIKTWKATALEGTSGFSALTCFMSAPQPPTDSINTQHFSCISPASAAEPPEPQWQHSPAGWEGERVLLEPGQALGSFQLQLPEPSFGGFLKPQFVS